MLEHFQIILHFILRSLPPLIHVAPNRHLFCCMVYDVRYVIGLFGVSPPIFDPQIVNFLHLGCHIIWMSYVSCWTVGFTIQDLLMLLFGPLTDIVIVIAIHVQRLLLFCVCTHSCSPDAILVVLSHLSYHLIRIFTHSCGYDVHISMGMVLVTEFPLSPTDVVSVVSDLAAFA